MIDRPEGGERTVLVHINFPAGSMQEDLSEFKELASSAGAVVVDVVTATRHAPEPKYFIGTGKADDISACVKHHDAELVIFNHALSPAQERNLERLLQCRVVDRTGLILDIFAQRARSFEGKLQVELAFLKHLSTRLVRGWTHLERQRGGIGLRGGPGETQLEIDRRLIRDRIQYISKRLTKVRKQREQGRRSRQKKDVPTIALVGYTNAGKSTLFNQLTGEQVYVANRLFATLDPTLRSMQLPEVGSVILADTVGFIRHLPHDLVQAFHATLQEVAEADLLLHVVDAHDVRCQENITEVQSVLTSIDAETVPQILVFNKMDLCPHFIAPYNREVKAVRVSALEAQGFAELQQAIIDFFSATIIQKTIVLTHADAKLRAELYRLKAVITEQIDEEGNAHLLIRLPTFEWEKLQSRTRITK